MNRYVAFLDIMGFAALVKELPLETVKAHVAQALRALERSQAAGPMLGFDQVPVQPVHVFSFSDTFVLLSDGDSIGALLSFLSATIYLTRTLYSQSLPVRGAVTFGEADFTGVGSSHAVGKAIIAAAELEKQQDWLGIAIDEAGFPDAGRALIARKEFAPVLLRWDVPLKEGRHLKAALVVNWFYNLRLQQDVKGLFRPSGDAGAQAKIENTLNFADHLQRSGLHKGVEAVRDKAGIPIFTPWLVSISSA